MFDHITTSRVVLSEESNDTSPLQLSNYTNYMIEQEIYSLPNNWPRRPTDRPLRSSRSDLRRLLRPPVSHTNAPMPPMTISTYLAALSQEIEKKLLKVPPLPFTDECLFFSLFLSCFVTDWPFFVDFELNLFLFFLKKYFHNVWLIEFFLLIWRLNCSSLFMFYDIFYSEWNFVSFFIISSCVIVFFFCWFGGWISPFSSMFCDFPPRSVDEFVTFLKNYFNDVWLIYLFVFGGWRLKVIFFMFCE